MKVGDLVRVKPSQILAGETAAGIIAASKGRCAFQDGVEVFWVLIDGRRYTYGSNQLLKVISESR